MRIKTKKRIALYSILVITLAVAYFWTSKIKKDEQAQLSATCTLARTRLAALSFESLNQKLGARAAYVYDFTKNQPLDAKNADIALPLASLTKLMTARVALKSVRPSTLYKITPEDLSLEASIGFSAGDQYPIHEILKAALIDSSNNAAVMLSHSTGISTNAFIMAMNTEAKNLNLPTLRYESVTGLDIAHDTIATAWGSAHDIVMLLNKNYTDYPDILAYSTYQTSTIYSSTGKSIPLVNTDKAIPQLPLLVASKTGYTDVAGGNLAVLWKEAGGHLLGASVLGSTEDGRFSDMIAIHRAADAFVSSSKSIDTFCPQSQ